MAACSDRALVGTRSFAWWLQVHSLGLGEDASGASLWVDMFGDDITRDLEPTVVRTLPVYILIRTRLVGWLSSQE